jgi:hypothetical protein
VGGHTKRVDCVSNDFVHVGHVDVFLDFHKTENMKNDAAATFPSASSYERLVPLRATLSNPEYPKTGYRGLGSWRTHFLKREV